MHVVFLTNKDKEELKKYIDDKLAVTGNGSAGSTVYMRAHEGYIQYSSDKETWENVIAISDLKGDRGLSAYQVAQLHGFEGTEDEWLASLKGEEGYTPQKGVDYFDGSDYTLTPADKQEIANRVIDTLPTWQGGSY